MANSLNHIPGDLRLPVVGDTVGFLTRPTDLYDEKQRQYGNVFKMQIFGRAAVYLLGAEANKFVLIDQAKHMSSWRGWQFPIGELFHGGLMLRDGDDHKHHRGLLQTAFKKEPMLQYLRVMEPIVRQRVAEWGQQAEIRVFPAVKALTLELAGKVFFNLDFSADLQRINQAIADIVRASTTAVPFNLPFTLYRRGMQSRNILQDYFAGIIQQRRANPGSDMLSQLCQAEDPDGQRLTDREIIDHLIFFIMAAHDTTASSLTSLMYELATHRHWQERLRSESAAFGQSRMDFQTLGRLEQLGWVVQETLRLHPPLILIPRVATTDLEYDGYKIPAGTHVNVLLYHNQQNPAYWTNPTQFDPERFAPGRAEHRKCPHAYAPFGAGQHYCLGFAFADMQLRLIMHHILTTYRWNLPANYVVAYNPIPIQHPRDGLRMELHALQPKSTPA